MSQPTSPDAAPEPLPAEAFPVSVLIRQEMAARDWSIGRLRVEAGLTSFEGRCLLDLILWCDDPDLLLGEEGASALAKAFGIGAEMWLRTDEYWRRWKKAQGRAPVRTEPSEPHRWSEEALKAHFMEFYPNTAWNGYQDSGTHDLHRKALEAAYAVDFPAPERER